MNTRLLQSTRALLATIVSPIYVIADSPYRMSREAGRTLATRDSLQAENERLEQQNLQLAERAQQFVALQEENARLRALLGSRQRLGAEVLVAELVGVVPAPNTFQVEIDKGASDGVFIGMKVRHGKFGVGTVRKVEGEGEGQKVVVWFNSVGPKKLMLRFAGLERA